MLLGRVLLCGRKEAIEYNFLDFRSSQMPSEKDRTSSAER
jgi:hypothetical protein